MVDGRLVLQSLGEVGWSTTGAAMDLKKYIRDVPDFPKAGILFRDITPLLLAPEAFRAAVDEMAGPWVKNPPGVFACIEARGFLFASALAYKLAAGVAIIRKPGKLPWKTRAESYSLEYGKDRIEIHEDAVKSGQRVVLVDDLLATGGTMAAAARLVTGLGGRIEEFLFAIELADLKGRDKLTGAPVRSLLTY